MINLSEKTRNTLIDNISDYLEKDLCFWDYDFKPVSEYKNRDIDNNNSMISTYHFRYSNTLKKQLDQVISEFSYKYRNIIIYI
jgi:hypothetical protein